VESEPSKLPESLWSHNGSSRLPAREVQVPSFPCRNWVPAHFDMERKSPHFIHLEFLFGALLINMDAIKHRKHLQFISWINPAGEAHAIF
jgi:hypothetical protein